MLGVYGREVHRLLGVRHRLIDRQLPVGPTSRERFIDVDLARRCAILSRNKFVSDPAIIRDEEREVIWCLCARRRHCRRASGRSQVRASAMWIWCCLCGRNTFPADRDQHRRIIRLIRHRIRFAILNPKIRPVIVDLETERTAVDWDVASKIFRDIKTRFFSAQRNRNATFVSPATAGRRFEPYFRAGATAFGRAPDLFVGRFAEGKD